MTLLVMDDDVAAGRDRRRVTADRSAGFVVVDDGRGRLVPDANPERVHLALVGHSDLEGIVSSPVDGAAALELGSEPTCNRRHDEPIVRGAVEVDVADLALELGLAVGE